MKREIKFRAYSPKNKEMYYDNENYVFVIYPTYIAFEPTAYQEELTFFSNLEDDEDFIHVMQFTGLRDKNGKEIYEGDVVAYHAKSGVEGIDDVPKIGVITFIKGEFCIRREMDPIIAFSREVIGNIYENPELLRSAIGTT